MHPQSLLVHWNHEFGPFAILFEESNNNVPISFDWKWNLCAQCSCKFPFFRAKKVHDGVTHAAKLFPNAYLVMIMIGAVKGNGEAFIQVGERLCRGVWTPEVIEFLRPKLWVFWGGCSFCRFELIDLLAFFSPTKASVAAALVFVLDKKTDLISAPHALVYFGIVIFFVYFKVRKYQRPFRFKAFV